MGISTPGKNELKSMARSYTAPTRSQALKISVCFHLGVCHAEGLSLRRLWPGMPRCSLPSPSTDALWLAPGPEATSAPGDSGSSLLSRLCFSACAHGCRPRPRPVRPARAIAAYLFVRTAPAFHPMTCRPSEAAPLSPESGGRRVRPDFTTAAATAEHAEDGAVQPARRRARRPRAMASVRGMRPAAAGGVYIYQRPNNGLEVACP